LRGNLLAKVIYGRRYKKWHIIKVDVVKKIISSMPQRSTDVLPNKK